MANLSGTERQLLETLLDLDQKIRQMPGSDPKPDLIPIFTRIDELADQLPAGTEPVLLHYLRKKSYEKALLFLQGRDAENAAGNCRHTG